MIDKFSIEDLLIKIMPGGFLLTALYFLFRNEVQFSPVENLDFFYAFLFFCSAYIVGELLQTITHEIEWTIDIFFKFRRPSEVFLYKNNPIIESEYARDELMEKLKLDGLEVEIFNQRYKTLSYWWWKKNKENDGISQGIFWKLYSQVSQTDEIKISNRNYLFVRVMMLEFLILGIIVIFDKNFYLSILSFLLCIIFLWRSRGVAKGLVFKVALLNLKNN
jgi:hypothetical protein